MRHSYKEDDIRGLAMVYIGTTCGVMTLVPSSMSKSWDSIGSDQWNMWSKFATTKGTMTSLICKFQGKFFSMLRRIRVQSLAITIYFGVFVFHKPIHIELRWIVLGLGSLPMPHTFIINQVFAGWYIHNQRLSMLQWTCGEWARVGGMEAEGLFAYTLNALEVQDIIFLGTPICYPNHCC